MTAVARCNYRRNPIIRSNAVFPCPECGETLAWKTPRTSGGHFIRTFYGELTISANGDRKVQCRCCQTYSIEPPDLSLMLNP